MESGTKVHKLGILPIAQGFIEDLGISGIFDKIIPRGEEEISHGMVLNILLLNLLDSGQPLYKVSDWLSPYSDGIGELPILAGKYHDKRLGSALDALYSASRHTILTEISSKAIALHGLDTGRVHNDTTTVTFSGAYERDRGKGSEVKLTQGYNKDHRPDMKQVVFGLNVCADGHVPLLSHLYSGNQSDSGTHQDNWQSLRALLGTVDFHYIADSKLSSTENLMLINDAGGKFTSILPATRKEVKAFHSGLSQGDIPASGTWEQAMSKADSRKKGEEVVYRTYEAGGTQEGFRLIFVHSSAKARQDAQSRQAAIEGSLGVLAGLKKDLNQYYRKTEEQIRSYIKEKAGKGLQFIDIELVVKKETTKRKVGAGRVGPSSIWREEETTTYELKYGLNQGKVDQQAKTDGVFPLVTNTVLKAAEVLGCYKDQPYLEKRFSTLKSVLVVAPVFLKKPERVEAMLLLYLIALMIVALIERKIRKEMEAKKIKEIPILPRQMKTQKPTWNNIQFCFCSAIMVYTMIGGVTQTTVKGIGKDQIKVLHLLGVDLDKYYQTVQIDWFINPKRTEELIQKLARRSP